MSCCTLGARPDIESVTKAMLPVDQGGEGMTVRAVAERFQVKRYLIERHWGCLKGMGHAPGPRKPPPRHEAPESERRPVQTAPQTSSQTKATQAQTSTDTEQTAVSVSARPRSLQMPEADDEHSYRAHVIFIANLLTLDRYNGRKTNLVLMKQWGLSLAAVQERARAAAVLVSKDRGPLELQREVTLARLETIRKAAMGEATANCPACNTKVTMPIGKHPDLKAAISATQHMDRVSGVLVNAAPILAQINIFQNQAFAQVWAVASEALKAFPGAAEAVELKLIEFEEQRRMANMLPARQIVDAEQAA